MSVRILTGDVRAMLATLDAESVDCVVTSPPYWGLRDYGVDGQIGLEPTLGEHLDVIVDVMRAVRRVMKPQATLWLNYGDCYATKPNGRSAADTKAAGRDDRTFRDKPFDTVSGSGLKPKDLCLIPERLAIALQGDGWWVRAKNVWGKPNPMPDSSGKWRPSVSHEMVWMLAKSSSCYFDAEAVAQPLSGDAHARTTKVAGWTTGDVHAHDARTHNSDEGRRRRKAESVAAARPPHSRPHTGLTSADDKRRRGKGQRLDSVLVEDPRARETRYLRQYEDNPALSVWRMPTAGFSEAHFATFPPELAELCILAGSPKGGLVLDPFFGAGTTGLVADALSRDCIGIELSADYAAIAARRLKAGCVRVQGGDSRRGLSPLPLEQV